MKKNLLFLSIFLLLTGCSSEESGTSGNIDGNTKKEYTNKFECSMVENISKYTLDKRNGALYESLEEELNARNNSTTAIERKMTKTYDFNKEGTKLIGYYEVETYTYIVDVDMKKEKEYYNKKCDGVEEYGYTNCKISVKDNVITISKESDPKAEYNKDAFETITKESIKKDYAEGETYSCTEE